MTREQLTALAALKHVQFDSQGEHAENARLRPLLTALIEDREALRDALACVASNGDGRGMGWTAAQHSRIALAASDARLREIAEGEK